MYKTIKQNREFRHENREFYSNKQSLEYEQYFFFYLFVFLTTE